MMARRRSDVTDGFRRENASILRVRQGFVLPLVFGAMAVLALFFTLMSFLSSGQTHAAGHFIDSARSLSIARAGAEWAVSAYASGTYDEKDPLCQTLFGSSAKEDEFELQYPKELFDYVQDELYGTLVVKVKVSDINSLPIPDGLQGFKQDPVEKSGVMEFSAVGCVGKASRRVRIRKGFKVVMMVHPVLSKFTLFLREKPDEQDVNVLERTTAGVAFENGGSPIVLNNQGFDTAGTCNAFSVVTPRTQKFDLSVVTRGGFAKLIQNSGWVFLNAQTPQPWILNLSGGGDHGEYDDRLLLRTAVYHIPSLEENITKELPSGEIIKGVCERFQGMKTDYETTSSEGDVQKKPSKVLHLRYLFPNDPPKASLIRPFGTNYKFSPTLVFGPVQTRYLVFRGIDVYMQNAGSAGGKLYPNALIPGFLNEADFVEAYKPKNPDDVAMADFARIMSISDRNNPGKDYPRYSNIMTKIATSSYIEALDYIFLDAPESGTLLRPKFSDYTSPPPKMINDAGSPDIRPWIGNRDSLLKAQGAFGMDETPLFSGNLADIKGCKEFQSKVTAVFPSFKELEASFLEKNSSRLRLPGIVYVGKEDLILDKDLEITSPGIIISGGNICIKSVVKSRHPVTIVSLKDITVETSNPIEAHLICLMGTFRAKGGFNIKGGLAARSLDMSNMRTNEKNISFAPAHDPYSDSKKWKLKTAYRYQLSQGEEYFIEGGKK